jgi:hypothetical protein
MLTSIMAGALLLAGALILALVRRGRQAERRAADAERTAGGAWNAGYQAGAGETNAKRDREARASYDKGFESGWNTCVTQFEDRPEYKDTAAA